MRLEVRRDACVLRKPSVIPDLSYVLFRNLVHIDQRLSFARFIFSCEDPFFIISERPSLIFRRILQPRVHCSNMLESTFAGSKVNVIKSYGNKGYTAMSCAALRR